MSERQRYSTRPSTHIGFGICSIWSGITRVVEQLAAHRQAAAELPEQIDDFGIVGGCSRAESGHQRAKRPALGRRLQIRRDGVDGLRGLEVGRLAIGGAREFGA